jgi:uncharacterized iron-regulated protein
MKNTHQPLNAGFLLVILLGLLVTISACSGLGDPAAGTASMNKSADADEPYPLKFQGHPLAVKIWSTREQRFIDQSELVKRLAGNDYILLGETHDNSDHHKYESWVIDQLAAQKINAGVAFEMIDMQQGKQLKKTKITSASQLISLLGKTGWQYDTYYRPVFDSVFQAGFPFFPANIGRNQLMTMLSNGKEQLPAKMQQQLDANPLTAKQKADMEEEISKSHCGMSTPEMTDAMILGQHIRDATMSDSLFEHKHQGLETMVLVAGSGHVRKDRGVPHYLRNKDKNAKILTLAWLEVYKDANNVKDYAEYWGDAQLPFDYVWFTPQAERPDPCEEMRKFMQKHNQKRNKEHVKPTPETKSI